MLNKYQLQLALAGFCLSPVPDMLREADRGLNTGASPVGEEQGKFEFDKDGDLENEDYDKASIYSLLYALYANAGECWVCCLSGRHIMFCCSLTQVFPSPPSPRQVR